MGKNSVKLTADQIFKKIPPILWNPQIYCHVDKTPATGPSPEPEKPS